MGGCHIFHDVPDFLTSVVETKNSFSRCWVVLSASGFVRIPRSQLGGWGFSFQNDAQCYTSHPFHISPLLCAFPPRLSPSPGKRSTSVHRPKPGFPGLSWCPPQLLHLQNLCGILFLYPGGTSPLKFSIPTSWLEPFHQPSSLHAVPMQLCKTAVLT